MEEHGLITHLRPPRRRSRLLVRYGHTLADQLRFRQAPHITKLKLRSAATDTPAAPDAVRLGSQSNPSTHGFTHSPPVGSRSRA